MTDERVYDKLTQLADALRTFVDLSRDTFNRKRLSKQTFRKWLENRAANTELPITAREADALLTAMDLLGITE